MRYRVTNKTKNIKTDDIHTAILFCAPRGIDNFTVTVSNIDDLDPSLWRAHVWNFKEIPSVKFFFKTKGIKFPQTSNDREAKQAGYYPICLIKDKYELLIYLVAHELRHIWQTQVSKQEFFRRKEKSYQTSSGFEYQSVFGAERDACQYAKRMLERYRKL